MMIEKECDSLKRLWWLKKIVIIENPVVISIGY